ncbi:MAG: type I methionyl aminopeptidase, partial [Nitrospirota bacterium]|nr:type I methionyl aminopeptidase [Nitrospirota bacterium]
MIILKSKAEVEKIAKASRIVASTLQGLKAYVSPGMTTLMLDAFAEKRIIEAGGIPAFKGYRNFPATLCVSVNEEVVHGIPSDKVLKDGDIVGMDLGVIVDGFYGDAAITVPIGEVDEEILRLLDVTEKSLYAGISQGLAGGRLSDISHAVQSTVEPHGYSIVTDFVG